MLSDRYKNDRKSIIPLSNKQLIIRNNIISKIECGTYILEDKECLCRADENNSTIAISEKDRYGIPLNTIICSNCSLIRINPRMNQDSYDAFYYTEYRHLFDSVKTKSIKYGIEGFKNWYFFNQRNRGFLIYSHAKNILAPKSKVLEIGCGAGGILSVFAENGHKCVGVDLGDEYLDVGRGHGLSLVCGHSSELINAHEDSFDFIILCHVMEHFLDIEMEFKTIKRLLKRDAYICIYVPDLLNHLQKNILRRIHIAHIYYFNKSNLKSLLEGMGFKHIPTNNNKIKGVFKYSIKEIFKYTGDTTPIKSNKEIFEDTYKKLLHLEKGFFNTIIRNLQGSIYYGFKRALIELQKKKEKKTSHHKGS